MVKRFLLPDSSAFPVGSIHEMSRSSFNSIQNLWEGIHPGFLDVHKRGENHVHVIRHDHHNVQLVPAATVM